MTINQRLKFLIENLSTSVRAFSEKIGESTGNTNNYIGKRQLAPKHEYLAKVLKHFSGVNAYWLMTGEGEPFNSDAPTPLTQTNISGDRNNVASGKGGKAIQKNYGLSECEKERDGYRIERDAARQELESLRAQLEMKDVIIAAKEETLTLLRATHNRPN